VGYVSALETERTAAELQEKAETFKRKKAIQGQLTPVTARDMTRGEARGKFPRSVARHRRARQPDRAALVQHDVPDERRRDDRREQRRLPAARDGAGHVCGFQERGGHRPREAAVRIAQIGKSFRNEITPRNFIFRSREFEQMEMEYFISEDADWAKEHRAWIDWCKDWLKSIGLPDSHLSEYHHPKEKLAFYSKGTTDIMFKYPLACRSCGASPRAATTTSTSTRRRAGSRWIISTRPRRRNSSRT